MSIEGKYSGYRILDNFNLVIRRIKMAREGLFNKVKKIDLMFSD